MSTAPTITDALAGARYSVPLVRPVQSVLVAGAAGRLGERVLAQALGAQHYQRIFVLASDEMRSTESRLTALTWAGDWNTRVDHVVAVVSESNDGLPSNPRKRTEVFETLGQEQILTLAQKAKEQGATRFMLVTLTDSLFQPSALHGHPANVMEMELHRLGFESLIIVRPSLIGMRRRSPGIAGRLTGMLVDTAAGLMMGLRHAPLSLENTANALMHALQEGGKGMQIIETEALHQLVR